jgi:lipopolysaccharide transport system permease protein
MTTQTDQSWDMIIRPQRAWWDLRLGELWKYRDLIRLWMWRDFVSVNKQTVLGPLWYLFSPIVGAFTSMIFFNKIARISTGEIPPMLFYLPGMMIWGYFTSVLDRSSTTLLSNAGLFSKVYFPRLIMPLSSLASALIGLALQTLTFVGMAIIFSLQGFELHLTLWLFALPFFLLITAFMGMGIGLIFASLTTRYRDFQKVIGPSLQLVQYATPIVYPATLVPDFLRPYIFLNPMVPLVEGFRYSLLGSGILPNFMQLLYAIGVTVVVLIIGVVRFNRAESNAADTV